MMITCRYVCVILIQISVGVGSISIILKQIKQIVDLPLTLNSCTSINNNLVVESKARTKQLTAQSNSQPHALCCTQLRTVASKNARLQGN